MLKEAGAASKMSVAKTNHETESKCADRELLRDCWNAIEQLEGLEESERSNEKEISALTSRLQTLGRDVDHHRRRTIHIGSAASEHNDDQRG